ncbi:CdaR family protein [Kiritimatiellota bacterium B12222]|nr:CdaR family protein [Kiritimatiellota bacterium B12222]
MRKLRLLHNYKLKGMALVLAILSWVIVKQITNNDKEVKNVPVRILYPDGWAIRDKSINEVQVTFRGTLEDLANLDRKSVQVNVDLRAEAYEPEKIITLSPRQVSFTGGNTRIISIEPSVVELQLGREGSKQLPVIVSQTGTPPEGFKVEAIEVDPPLSTLVGAEDLLESISSLQTVPINLSDKIQSFDQRVDLLLPHPEWVGKIEPSRVFVRVTLAGLTVERKFSKIPVMLTYPAGKLTSVPLTAIPVEVDVYLKGSPQLLDQLDIRKVQAFVTVESTDGQGGNSRKVNVLVPAGIEVLGVQPDRIELKKMPAPTPVPTAVSPTPTPLPTATPVPPRPQSEATPVS